jgi:hypothetical protein
MKKKTLAELVERFLDAAMRVDIEEAKIVWQETRDHVLELYPEAQKDMVRQQEAKLRGSSNAVLWSQIGFVLGQLKASTVSAYSSTPEPQLSDITEALKPSTTDSDPSTPAFR